MTGTIGTKSLLQKRGPLLPSMCSTLPRVNGTLNRHTGSQLLVSNIPMTNRALLLVDTILNINRIMVGMIMDINTSHKILGIISNIMTRALTVELQLLVPRANRLSISTIRSTTVPSITTMKERRMCTNIQSQRMSLPLLRCTAGMLKDNHLPPTRSLKR